VDDTTDKCGGFIANLLISKLDGQKWHTPQLIAVKPLENCDLGAVARFVNQELGKIFLFKMC
jgi:hypothetical protein